jgi:hypothetical protein
MVLIWIDLVEAKISDFSDCYDMPNLILITCFNDCLLEGPKRARSGTLT